jgi:hypothetical protein
LPQLALRARFVAIPVAPRLAAARRARGGPAAGLTVQRDHGVDTL